MSELIIGGDIAPTDMNIKLFNKGDLKSLLGSELSNIWNEADIRLFNLEVPLTNKNTPIDKQGPNLKAPTSTINGIKALNPTLVTLANNHILDYGEQGLNSTYKLLREKDIPSVGAGDNLKQASKPYIIKKSGVAIGIYSCAENEFTIATENSAGANPFDPLESLDHILELKSKCDYVIVLHHGGKEHYRYPSPSLQKVCRKIVEKGADLVICQHSHCIGSFEEYEGSTIVYGQGNFIYNDLDNEYWNTSLLVKVDIKKSFNVEFIPLARTRDGTKLATGNTADKILDEFYKRSREMLLDDFIDKEYKRFAKENMSEYIREFARFGKWKSRFDRRLFKNLMSNGTYKKQELLAIQNYIECEAHRELLLKGLKEKVNSGK